MRPQHFFGARRSVKNKKIKRTPSPYNYMLIYSSSRMNYPVSGEYQQKLIINLGKNDTK